MLTRLLPVKITTYCSNNHSTLALPTPLFHSAQYFTWNEAVNMTDRERPSDNTSDTSVKRQRIGENVENKEDCGKSNLPLKSSAEDVKDLEPQIEENKGDIQNEEKKCTICFKGASEDVQVFAHQCGQCRADSWHACEACNDALLSRACPLCRTDYAPKVYHLLPGMALHKVMDPSMAPMEKILTTIKIKFLVERVFPLTNALCILPSGIAQFSITKAANDDAASEVIIVRTKVDGTEIETGLQGDAFHFRNKCWDLIEKTSEEDSSDDNTAQTLDVKIGAKKMIQACMTPGAKVYTLVSAEEWEDLEQEWKEEI